MEQLRKDIFDLENLLQFMSKYQLVISHNGLMVLFDQLRNMRKELIDREYAEQVLTQRQIQNN
jgi:hypothetical protein